MSRFLNSLSSLVNGNADRAPRPRDAAEGDAAAASTPAATPLVPLNAGDAEPAGTSPSARRGAAAGAPQRTTDGAEATPSNALVPLGARHKAGRASPSSRALNAVVRATTQVALASHVEPTPPPKTVRAGHGSTVVLTQTERLRLQIMQVQLKLRGLELYDGAIDGVMNPELVDAVRHFQVLKGMRDSGALTTGTLTALGVRTLD